MRFGQFIRKQRLANKIKLRTAMLATQFDSARLSELEREVSIIPPSQLELDVIKKVYQIDSFDCETYSFDQKRFDEESQTLKLIKTKTPEELMSHGIFVCQTHKN
jgi:hypothetical protein